MHTQHLFDVVFEGRPLPGIPKEKAIDGLAGLLRKESDDIAHLFNERQKVLKRGVSRETALQYRKALRNAGLAVHITNDRSPLDTDKVKQFSALDANSASPLPAGADYEPVVVKKNTIKTSKQMKSKAEFNSPLNRWTEYWQAAVILSLLIAGLAFFSANAKSPLQAGLLTAFVFFISYPCTRFILKLFDDNIFGLLVASILLGGGPLAILMCYGSVRGFAKLLRVKQFFTVYLAISIILVAAVSVMAPSSDNDSPKRTKEANARSATRSVHTLHQLDLAIRSYIVEFGMTPKPLTRTVFKEVLDRYVPSGVASSLFEKLEEGSLKLQGDLVEYRIGIYENDQWTILNERGEIRQEKEF